MVDAQILEQFKEPASRAAAFRTLVETYQTRLYAHLRRILGNHDDTDDVLQETFIKVWRNLAQFEGKSSLYTWLYRIATHEALRFLAQQKKKRFWFSFQSQQKQALSFENASFFALSQGQAQSLVLDEARIGQMLADAIATLPEKQRIVFLMRYYDETPYEEMSQILDTSVGALKASYHQAAKKITRFVSIDLENL
ncbi:RNA polymerase sigma factor [Hugenholtzia roseola]|uniref:RNA polymerase sigma factor n=1 Tax=Hugenholtzia roseola TaxID=1002 RepID=UPI0004120F9D|nr:RNA polymerase sigma factor [Hugenholtzia roseola]